MKSGFMWALKGARVSGISIALPCDLGEDYRSLFMLSVILLFVLLSQNTMEKYGR